jgi:hypothetical protein
VKTKLLIALFMAVYLVIAVFNPHGDWDAWSIWNFRAKFLYFDGLSAFSAVPDWAHLEYPPLLPALVALGWRLTGGVSTGIPILLHGLVLLATLWIVRKPLWTMALVGVVAVQYAPTQFADLPLALTLLVAVAMHARGHDGLTGLALGMGALIKNEGALILLAFVAASTITERKPSYRLLTGAAGPMIVLIAFKVLLPVPPNDVVGAGGITERLFDVQRYLVIVQFAGIGLARFGLGVPLLLVLNMAADRIRVSWSVPLLAILISYFGYLAI